MAGKRKRPLNLYDCIVNSDSEGPDVCQRCKRLRPVMVPWPKETNKPMCLECLRKLVTKLREDNKRYVEVIKKQNEQIAEAAKRKRETQEVAVWLDSTNRTIFTAGQQIWYRDNDDWGKM